MWKMIFKQNLETFCGLKWLRDRKEENEKDGQWHLVNSLKSCWFYLKEYSFFLFIIKLRIWKYKFNQYGVN